MKTYIAIDLKSFYASVECIERSFDPLTTNLVVADSSRTEKTICLAVSPSLKSYGIPGRARLFEVVQKVKEVNLDRRKKAGFISGESFNDLELRNDPSLAVGYLIAPPRMAHYIEYSTRIYNIYLKYVSSEDIHVYSIDEVFIDVTSYLKNYHMSAKELARAMIKDVYDHTGITATCGIGSNLYLCKVAMDIVAKKSKPDENGVRIAELSEQSYKEKLWDYRPLTDFWRVGRGISKKLEENGLFTMGDIARKSIEDEDFLYKLFGINAELLIDHAWGIEPCEMKHIKEYKPENNSLASGQVLHCGYTYDKARLVVNEMIEQLSLDLVSKQLVTDQLVLTIGYDIENLTNTKIKRSYQGEIVTDPFGRQIPKHAHGTTHLKFQTSSTKLLTEAMLKLFDQITNQNLLVRRINMTACNIIHESKVIKKEVEQLDLFTNYEIEDKKKKQQEIELEKEKNLQKTLLNIKKKYGKNSILKVQDLDEDATTKKRNEQIGGHSA